MLQDAVVKTFHSDVGEIFYSLKWSSVRLFAFFSPPRDPWTFLSPWNTSYYHAIDNVSGHGQWTVHAYRTRKRNPVTSVAFPAPFLCRVFFYRRILFRLHVYRTIIYRIRSGRIVSGDCAREKKKMVRFYFS